MKYFLIILSVFFVFSCGKKDQTSGELKLIKGHWGHSEDIAQTSPSSMFLIHVDRGENYQVCLAEYMKEDHPGIEAEIKASINIWAYYIGREIPTIFKTINLPRPRSNQSSQRLMENYYELCGNVDLVIGKSYFNGDTIGRTNSSYSYRGSVNGQRQVVSFKRGLFLRQQDLEWITLSQYKNSTFSESDIFKLLKERKTKFFSSSSSQKLTLRTILHEIGHVWGLCDQYEGVENCDPRYSIAKNHDSVMGAAQFGNRIYLTNDDITGLRKYGEREDFLHSWPRKEEFSKISIADEQNKNLEHFQINETKLNARTLEVNFSIATNSNFSLQFSLYDSEKGQWIDFSASNQDKMSVGEFRYRLRMPSQFNADKLKVKIKFTRKLESSDALEYFFEKNI